MNLAQYTPRAIALHPEHPQLYAGLDTLLPLSECPFPTVTDTFKIVAYGQTTQQGNGRNGESCVVVVDYVKACGHRALDRIAFFEGVADFTHHGTFFPGAGYSIANWGERIEYFRRTLCPVCDIFEHCRWAHFHAGERTAPRKRTLARFDLLMSANFLNWSEFVTRADFEKAIQSPENKALSLRTA